MQFVLCKRIKNTATEWMVTKYTGSKNSISLTRGRGEGRRKHHPPPKRRKEDATPTKKAEEESSTTHHKDPKDEQNASTMILTFSHMTSHDIGGVNCTKTHMNEIKFHAIGNFKHLEKTFKMFNSSAATLCLQPQKGSARRDHSSVL